MYYADREQYYYWPENIMPEKMQEILLLFIENSNKKYTFKLMFFYW